MYSRSILMFILIYTCIYKIVGYMRRCDEKGRC